MKFNDKVYDCLKYLTIICLPAVQTFYAAVSKIWGFPYSVEVTGTIGAVATLLGALICISTAEYNKEKEKNDD